MQRAFDRWYMDNQARFEIPLKIKRTKSSLRFSFIGLHPALFGWVSIYELMLATQWQGRLCEGWLRDFDADPKKLADGFICELCESNPKKEGPVTVYPSKRQLWEEHSFDPFLTWVNVELTQVRWLGFYRYKGATWSKLLVNPEDTDTECNAILLELIPVKHGSRNRTAQLLDQIAAV